MEEHELLEKFKISCLVACLFYLSLFFRVFCVRMLIIYLRDSNITTHLIMVVNNVMDNMEF